MIQKVWPLLTSGSCSGAVYGLKFLCLSLKLSLELDIAIGCILNFQFNYDKSSGQCNLLSGVGTNQNTASTITGPKVCGNSCEYSSTFRFT